MTEKGLFSLLGIGDGSTGLVDGGLDIKDEASKIDNAFIGDGTLSGSDNKYFDIINEYIVTDAQNKITSIGYKAPYDGYDSKNDTSKISSIDASAQTYDTFSPATMTAVPYDDTLHEFYNGKYNFKSIVDLAGVGATDPEKNYFVCQRHYGDWPAPEIFVINKRSNPSGSSG